MIKMDPDSQMKKIILDPKKLVSFHKACDTLNPCEGEFYQYFQSECFWSMWRVSLGCSLVSWIVRGSLH